MSRKIIIPKGLVENPDQSSIIEVSSRLSQSKGHLIAKRQGKKLVAQQLPDWQDDLSSPQATGRASENTFIASLAGCTTPSKTASPRGNDTYYSDALSTTRRRGNFSSRNATNNDTYYSNALSVTRPENVNSQNATVDGSNYQSALGDFTGTSARTCYNTALEQTPSSARLNITGNDASMNATVESNVQMNDFMFANILNESRRNLQSSDEYTLPRPTNLFAADESSDDYALGPVRRLPGRPAEESSKSLGSNQFNSECRYSTDSYDGSSTSYVRPPPPSPGYVRPIDRTYPAAARPTRYKQTNDTYPMGANQIGPGENCPCASPEITEDSGFFDGNISFGDFQPALSSSRMAPPSPPNQTFAEPSGQPCPGNQTFAGAAANQTFASMRVSPGSPQTLPRASRRSRRSRPGQDTFPRSANRSMLESGSIRSPCSSAQQYGSRDYITPPPNQSFARTPSPRPSPKSRAQTTFAGSAAQQTFLGAANQTFGSPPGGRMSPSQSFGQGCPGGQTTFARPAINQTFGSPPGGRMSPSQSFGQGARGGQTTFAGPALNQTYGSPPGGRMSPSQSFGQGCPGGQTTFARPALNQTFGSPPGGRMSPSQSFGQGARGGQTTFAGPALNQTFGSPPARGGQTTFAGPAVNQTFGSPLGGGCGQACPGSQTFAESPINRTAPAGRSRSYSSSGGRMPAASPQTLPRASRRTRRSRPGQDTFPRSANRSMLEGLDESPSQCQPCSDPEFEESRDFATDESYERFEPWQVSSMNSLTYSDDSSEEYEQGPPLTRSTVGRYNIITPMTPSPEKKVDECGCGSGGAERVVSYESQVVEDVYDEY